MREQRHVSELVYSCQRSLRLNWGYMEDLCCHLFFLQLLMLSLNWSDGV